MGGIAASDLQGLIAGFVPFRTPERCVAYAMIEKQPTLKGSHAGRPLVSVLVPSFNGAAYLREALDSILAQTYPSLEIILLDDFSSDETPDIAAEYGDRITYVRQPRNTGIYDNVNVGIEMARGDLIATYHADDIYLPEIVERQVTYFETYPEVGAVFTANILVDAQNREYHRNVFPLDVRGEKPLDHPTVLNALLKYKNKFLVCPTAMVRTAVHKEVGNYRQDRYRNTSDLEMWLRISRRYPIAILESHLMRYRHFHGNSSQRYHRLRTTPENYFIILDEYLAGGDRALATPEALVAYEAHRSQDRLMAAISHYIKDELPDGRRALREVDVRPIMRSPYVQRWRLLTLTAGMWMFLRLPRIGPLASRMHDRWHVKRPPRR
jgi:glycosyltransferase involved in cell wall biosynthesis